MQTSLNEVKKIHFIGIGGIGISAMAKLMKNTGKEVSGSDIKSSPICDDLKRYGVKIYIGHSESNIEKNTDLIIYSQAILDNNSELKTAKARGIDIISYPQALGMTFNNKYGIAICGTHGKSTTTAMVGLLLDDAQLDPTIIIGSIIPKYNSNLKIGKSQYYVAEACEYKLSFLNLRPKIIILNNIELDHTDCYRNLHDVKKAFKDFIENLPYEGTLICNGDDINIADLVLTTKFSYPRLKIIFFGQTKCNDLHVDNIRFECKMSKFDVYYFGKHLGEFNIKIPGLINIYNSLPVISLGITLGIPLETIKKSLSNYEGIWRRFELKGMYKKSVVISDYAHHPTAIKATIECAKIFYPDRKICAIFQPHQNNRFKELYDSFLQCFNGADIVIITEIFEAIGREKEGEQKLSAFHLVEDIVQNNSKLINKVFYAKNSEYVKELIDEVIQDECLLLFMTAGDLYKIADEIVGNRTVTLSN